MSTPKKTKSKPWLLYMLLIVVIIGILGNWWTDRVLEKADAVLENMKSYSPPPPENISKPKTIDVNYTIQNIDSMQHHKLSMDVLLKEPISKDELTSLANQLYRRHTGEKYDRVFILYFMENTSEYDGAWATTHFNPTLKVVIHQPFVNTHPN